MNSSESNRPQFLLVLRQPHGGQPGPDELRLIMGRFTEWMKSISAKGNIVGTNGLKDTGAVLRGPRGASVSDGPFAESKEIIGGYVLITADSLVQAIEIARECPGLDYRMTVEVRPVNLMRDVS